MKKLLIGVTLLTLTSCGKIESPQEFFDITGDTGKQGNDGQDGKDGDFKGQVQHVEVCNTANLEYVETLVLINGDYMAFMSDKNYKKQRLVLLEENVNYTTTDNRDIIFSIVNGSIVCGGI